MLNYKVITFSLLFFQITSCSYLEIMFNSNSLPYNEEFYKNLQETEHKCLKEIPIEFLKVYEKGAIYYNTSNPAVVLLEDCCDGYKRREYNSLIKCVPDCGDKCINGICVSPNNCECFPSFVKNEIGECVNTCPIGCLNGECRSDGSCQCLDSYNFQLNSDRTYCKPICRDGCNKPHQNCSDPNHCTCEKGYKFDLHGNCIPVCKADCYGGNCIAPNICKCNPGFELKDGICQSRCNDAICTNGFCETNGQCKCLDGYQYNDVTKTCLPTCKIDCWKGVCIGVNQCKCHRGYAQFRNRGPCFPICDIEKCVKPAICDLSEIKENMQFDVLRNLSPGVNCVS